MVHFSEVFIRVIHNQTHRHAGHCWRSKDELISDILLWSPAYGQAKAGQPARTYIQQLCEDMGCSPEDLPEVMNDREKWRERVRDIRASGMTWWWWWWIHLKCLNLQNKAIFITQNIWAIDLIFIVILTIFQLICLLTFFRCFMSSSRLEFKSWMKLFGEAINPCSLYSNR